MTIALLDVIDLEQKTETSIYVDLMSVEDPLISVALRQASIYKYNLEDKRFWSGVEIFEGKLYVPDLRDFMEKIEAGKLDHQDSYDFRLEVYKNP